MQSPLQQLTVACALLQAAACHALSFDGVEYWVGEGSQRAALVIDWDEQLGEGPALVWGYRWDGHATGEQMLLAVLEEDARLAAKVSSPGQLGISIYGVGYDANDDDALALTDGTNFGPEGVVETGPSDLATAVDPDDLYREGWFSAGFWHYTTAAAGESWVSSPIGVADRSLEDGGWDGMVFTSYVNDQGQPKTLVELYSSAPGEPAAAPAPGEPGDYNHDGLVDASDYTLWRDQEGAAAVVAGAGADGDSSGQVDAADYALWRDEYGATASSFSVPEPASLSAVLTVSVLRLLRRTARNDS